MAEPKAEVSAGAATADVCLLLEGTYPYVRGGVSTWVHQVISAMPDVRFAIVFVGAERRQAGKKKYEMPANIVSLQEVFLYDPEKADARSSRLDGVKLEKAHERLEVLLSAERKRKDSRELEYFATAALASLGEVAGSGVTFENFWRHPSTWESVSRFYQSHFSEASFIDFFWSARFLIQPLWKLLKLAPVLPRARVYHSVSTGYAGLLGALAGRRTGAAFLLSEHGIYVRERIAELLHAEWTPRPGAPCASESRDVSPFRKLWIDFFVAIGVYAYHSAAEIVSLFEKNAGFQVEFGAPEERIRVIPNGVALPRYEPIRSHRREKRRENPDRTVIGFLGRVVAIKDVKTLIRAARIVAGTVPGAQFLIVGPTDEEPGYFQECEQIVAGAGLRQTVRFTGSATLEEALPEFDILVLSSISEGLPFAVLEAFAAEIPVISTDVGSCPELIEGRAAEVPALGFAGGVVPVGDAEALAEAIRMLATDRALQDEMGRAGRRRVEAYYQEDLVIRQYREIYERLAQPEHQREPAAAVNG